MKKLKNIFLCLAVAMLLTATCKVYGEVNNRVVAMVNEDIITLHELKTAIERFTGLDIEDLKSADRDRYYQIREAILNNLINELITEQQVNQLGIKVTKEETDKALDRVKRINNLTQEDLLYSIKKEGLSLEEYRENIKKQIQHFRLLDHEVKSKIVITEENLKKYYNDHKEKYHQPGKVKLGRIFLKTGNPGDGEEKAAARKTGLEIMKSLEQGRRFSDMARQYSQGPAANEGGDLGWIKVSELDPEMREMIADLSPGEFTGLCPSPHGFHIIKLLERKHGGLKEFKEVKDAIYAGLFREKVEKGYAEWLKKMREKSFIKITF